MDPLTAASLLAQLGPAAMQFIQGRKQNKLASEFAKKAGDDPIMPIPESAQEALANARTNAASRYLPGQTNLQNQLDQGTANATSDVLRNSRSSLDALGALTAINANNQSNQAGIGFQAANSYQQRQGDLRDQLGIMSQWENKKWTNDVLNKFLRNAAAASALKNASMHNTYQGVKGAANAIGTTAGGMANEKFLKELLGQNTTTTQPGFFDTISTSSIEQAAPGMPTEPYSTPPINSQNSYTPQQITQLMQFLQSGGQTQYSNSGI